MHPLCYVWSFLTDGICISLVSGVRFNFNAMVNGNIVNCDGNGQLFVAVFFSCSVRMKPFFLCVQIPKYKSKRVPAFPKKGQLPESGGTPCVTNLYVTLSRTRVRLGA